MTKEAQEILDLISSYLRRRAETWKTSSLEAAPIIANVLRREADIIQAKWGEGLSERELRTVKERK